MRIVTVIAVVAAIITVNVMINIRCLLSPKRWIGRPGYKPGRQRLGRRKTSHCFPTGDICNARTIVPGGDRHSLGKIHRPISLKGQALLLL
jgi:hypothetical protein